MLSALAVENYRSLRRLVLPLGQLTVVTGANGTGKSSVYRALRLLAGTATGGAVAALAREGGLPSTLWAGPERLGAAVRRGEHPVQGTRRSGPVALRLGFAADDFSYAIDLGLPSSSGGPDSMFALDPEIKRESVWSGPVLRPAALLTDRAGPLVRTRGQDGDWTTLTDAMRSYDSVLSELADPERAPELLALRERVRSWRFYDTVRADTEAPARRRQVGTRTPVLAADGGDLAAALQTIREIGDADGLDRAVDEAFPGSRLEIAATNGLLDLGLRQPGMLRPLGVAELSDGTLRYLLWVAALLSPRPAPLLVLNEPETSLHPDLLNALADLVAAASARTQVVVVSHAEVLRAALAEIGVDGLEAVELGKELGATVVLGRDDDGPPWQWPSR